MFMYGQHDIGLYITTTDLAAYADANDQDPDDVAMKMGAHRYSEADGKARPAILPCASFKVSDHFYLLPLERYPTLFEAAYPSYQAALEELKKKAARYLPTDFNYPQLFIDYLGTICR